MTRDDLLAKTKAPRRVTAVTAGEWGTVHVRELSGAEFDAYQKACTVVTGKKSEVVDNRSLMLRMTVCDEAGELLFKPGDEAALADLPASILIPVANAAAAFLGAGDADPKAG